MKIICLIFTWLSTFGNICAQHKIINQFKSFVTNADFACYEQKIQQNVDKFDRWLIDSLPVLNNLKPCYKPSNVDLQKENKIFVLAVTLANTENYDFKDNIYDYLIIDSLRTFIIVCIDKRMNVTGITDTGEPGTFVDLNDDFYYYAKKWKETVKNINKEKPDLILYCEEWWGSFLYVKGGKIFYYMVKTGKGEELNEHLRKISNISIIRRSNEIILPYSKSFIGGSRPLLYRLTGHTPPSEVRMCPPLRK